jgi:hypothetical protein
MAGSMIKRVKSLISEKWRVVEPWSGEAVVGPNQVTEMLI